MVARNMTTEVRTLQQIPEFYANKNIFITGATGFMGKVLIERLLSTCPDIGNLYLLMREKKDQIPEKRLTQLKQSHVFDVLRGKNPTQLDKLRVLCGDTSQPDLGMDNHALQDMRGVSVVFHVAATLKFDEEIRKAVDENIRSIVRLMEICDRLPHVEALVHVSTAYCMAELSSVEERVYPPPCSREELEELLAKENEKERCAGTKKLLGVKPNTYTFTKAMAEHAVAEHKAKYPVAIFRPTIVISSIRDPVPGWIENLNGASGVVVAGGKGLLHAFRCKLDARADMLPVDIAIDTMIAVAWDIASVKSSSVRVYNSTTYDNPTYWHQFEKFLRLYVRQYPLDNIMWYPCAVVYSNKVVHTLAEWFLQTGPLYVAQYITKFFGMKTKINLIMVSHKLRAMTNVLEFFSMREWRFHNNNVKQLCERLSPADAKVFNLDAKTINWEEHYKNFILGVRRYLLKEKDEDIEKARKHLKIMHVLHLATKTVLLLVFLRLVLQNSEVARTFVYGTLRLLLGLFGGVYHRVFSPVQIST